MDWYPTGDASLFGAQLVTIVIVVKGFSPSSNNVPTRTTDNDIIRTNVISWSSATNAVHHEFHSLSTTVGLLHSRAIVLCSSILYALHILSIVMTFFYGAEKDVLPARMVFKL